MSANSYTQLQLLRGTSASNAAYVGGPGELTLDVETTEEKGYGIIRVHIGDSTPGGYLISGEGGTIDYSAFATTGSNTFIGNQIISGSLLITGSGLTVTGSTNVLGDFTATTKSFKIDHPTLQGKQLVYGSLESPYHGIRLTGEAILEGNICRVELPHYIKGLCRQENAQVQLTNVQHNKTLWVEILSVEDNYFTVQCARRFFDKIPYKFYWSFTAIRKDVEELQVEV
jgi:hypothetical protein